VSNVSVDDVARGRREQLDAGAARASVNAAREELRVLRADALLRDAYMAGLPVGPEEEHGWIEWESRARSGA
jgi:hypothetical protein